MEAGTGDVERPVRPSRVRCCKVAKLLLDGSYKLMCLLLHRKSQKILYPFVWCEPVTVAAKPGGIATDEAARYGLRNAHCDEEQEALKQWQLMAPLLMEGA